MLGRFVTLVLGLDVVFLENGLLGDLFIGFIGVWEKVFKGGNPENGLCVFIFWVFGVGTFVRLLEKVKEVGVFLNGLKVVTLFVTLNGVWLGLINGDWVGIFETFCWVGIMGSGIPVVLPVNVFPFGNVGSVDICRGLLVVGRNEILDIGVISGLWDGNGVVCLVKLCDIGSVGWLFKMQLGFLEPGVQSDELGVLELAHLGSDEPKIQIGGDISLKFDWMHSGLVDPGGHLFGAIADGNTGLIGSFDVMQLGFFDPGLQFEIWTFVIGGFTWFIWFIQFGLFELGLQFIFGIDGMMGLSVILFRHRGSEDPGLQDICVKTDTLGLLDTLHLGSKAFNLQSKGIIGLLMLFWLCLHNGFNEPGWQLFTPNAGFCVFIKHRTSLDNGPHIISFWFVGGIIVGNLVQRGSNEPCLQSEPVINDGVTVAISFSNGLQPTDPGGHFREFASVTVAISGFLVKHCGFLDPNLHVISGVTLTKGLLTIVSIQLGSVEDGVQILCVGFLWVLVIILNIHLGSADPGGQFSSICGFLWTQDGWFGLNLQSMFFWLCNCWIHPGWSGFVTHIFSAEFIEVGVDICISMFLSEHLGSLGLREQFGLTDWVKGFDIGFSVFGEILVNVCDLQSGLLDPNPHEVVTGDCNLMHWGSVEPGEHWIVLDKIHLRSIEPGLHLVLNEVGDFVEVHLGSADPGGQESLLVLPEFINGTPMGFWFKVTHLGSLDPGEQIGIFSIFFKIQAGSFDPGEHFIKGLLPCIDIHCGWFGLILHKLLENDWFGLTFLHLGSVDPGVHLTLNIWLGTRVVVFRSSIFFRHNGLLEPGLQVICSRLFTFCWMHCGSVDPAWQFIFGAIAFGEHLGSNLFNIQKTGWVGNAGCWFCVFCVGIKGLSVFCTEVIGLGIGCVGDKGFGVFCIWVIGLGVLPIKKLHSGLFEPGLQLKRMLFLLMQLGSILPLILHLSCKPNWFLIQFGSFGNLIHLEFVSSFVFVIIHPGWDGFCLQSSFPWPVVCFLIHKGFFEPGVHTRVSLISVTGFLGLSIKQFGSLDPGKQLLLFMLKHLGSLEPGWQIFGILDVKGDFGFSVIKLEFGLIGWGSAIPVVRPGIWFGLGDWMIFGWFGWLSIGLTFWPTIPGELLNNGTPVTLGESVAGLIFKSSGVKLKSKSSGIDDMLDGVEENEAWNFGVLVVPKVDCNGNGVVIDPIPDSGLGVKAIVTTFWSFTPTLGFVPQ